MLPKSESVFQGKLTKEDREELLKLQTLRDLPKSRYATQSCITALPMGRGRKVIYSHIEVYKMVEKIATDLREAGVRPQTPCAFVLQNCIEAVVYFLALQWIGAIAVPIDPTLSPEDIALVLKHVNATTLVSAQSDENEPDALSQKVETLCKEQNIIHWHICRSTNKGVFLDRRGLRAGEGAAWSGGAGDFKYDPSENCIRLANGQDGHFLVFEMSHRAVAEATRAYSNTYALTSQHSTLLASHFYEIQGLMSVMATIYSGGNVTIPQGSLHHASKLLQYAKENKTTWISAESSLVTEMYQELERDKSLGNGLILSFLRSNGKAITADLIEKMEPIFRVPVFESYGGPETCGLVSSNREQQSRPGTSGKTVSGCHLIVLDVDKNVVVPPTKEGRIAVRGTHISKYYLNSDYGNHTCYVEVSEGKHSKYYFATGDLGYLSVDGFLTVTNYSQPRQRASLLASQRSKKVQSEKDLEASLAAKTAEEQRRRQLEAEQMEEKRLQEEEDRKRLVEEARLAEEARLVEEARLAEKNRLKEEARLAEKAQAEEKARLAAKVRAEEEARLAEKARAEEEARLAEKARAEEEVRLAEKARAEEEARLAEKARAEEEARLAEKARLDEKARLVEEARREEERVRKEELRKEREQIEKERAAMEERALELRKLPAPAVTEITKIVETEKIPDEVVDEIMERLTQIETNQRRLEREMESFHRDQMTKLILRIEKVEAEQANEAARSPRQLEELKSVMEKAAASAESSSRDTATAAQAAQDAAAAATAAAAVQEGNLKHVMEIRDPSELQNTVLVSLEDIDGAIRSHPAVATARAFGRPDPRFGAEVFCAVNPKKGARVSEPWLMLHAQSKLPAAFVPKKFFFKETLSNNEERASLSVDVTLMRISEMSGYNSEKVIKSPVWTPRAMSASTPMSK